MTHRDDAEYICPFPLAIASIRAVADRDGLSTNDVLPPQHEIDRRWIAVVVTDRMHNRLSQQHARTRATEHAQRAARVVSR